MTLPTDHPVIPARKTGILLVNLGTPETPEARAVRRYLAEFLSDKRVVDYPRIFWLPLLHGIILNVRPAITARNYAKIWYENPSESPLRRYTRQQSEKLADTLSSSALIIDWAMRYGTPSMEAKILELKNAGCDRLVIIPLYPQYSATTTASVTDEAARILANMAWQPALRIAPSFHDEPLYIEALKQVTDQKLATLSTQPQRIIQSFHGIPERYFRNGDPYHCHCQKTARLLREAMGWDTDFAPLAFQSKFGREKWLGPSTESLVMQAAEEGLQHMAIIAPAFVADCIETLEELGIGLTETFKEKGGETLTLIPCLNASDEMIALLTHIAKRETAGWN